jgi:hypothetical protein
MNDTDLPLFKGETPEFSLHEREIGRDFKVAKRLRNFRFQVLQPAI